MNKRMSRLLTLTTLSVLLIFTACGASQQNPDPAASASPSASAAASATTTAKPSPAASAAATPTKTLDPYEEAIKAGNYEFLLEPTRAPSPTPAATKTPAPSAASSSAASASPAASASASPAASSSPAVSASASPAASPSVSASSPAQSTPPQTSPAAPNYPVYTGSGDALVQITPPGEPWVLYATGNGAQKFFSVKGTDAQGNPTETFIDTTAKYKGVTYDPTQSTANLEISATGDWTIELLPFSYLWTVGTEQKFSGNGDDVIKIAPQGEWVLYVTGNSGQKYFAVKGFNANNQRTELFVNTAEAYRGTTYDPSQSTALLQINATGNWTAELLPLSYLWTLTPGNTFNGKGDDVMKLSAGTAAAAISGNTAQQPFNVFAYGNGVNDLLVNTTEAYNGNVNISGNPNLLVVKATGDWNVTV